MPSIVLRTDARASRASDQKTTVWFSWTSTRSSRCRWTARASTARSMSRPMRTSVVHVVAVADARDVLLDDRAGVELLGDVVRGRADDLHAAVARLAVRVGAGERRQERVVDVDHRRADRARKSPRQDLHVAREHDEVERGRRAAPASPPPPRLRLGRDGHVGNGTPKPRDVRSRSRWLEITSTMSASSSPLRQRHSRSSRQWSSRETRTRCACDRSRSDRPVHRRAARRRARRTRAPARSRPRSSPSSVELHPHEERAALGIGRVLVGIEDVRAVLEQEARDGGDDARPVGAGDRAAARREAGPPPRPAVCVRHAVGLASGRSSTAAAYQAPSRRPSVRRLAAARRRRGRRRGPGRCPARP